MTTPYTPPAGFLSMISMGGLPAGLFTTTGVFPLFPGQDIAIRRTPMFKTGIKTAASGRERRTSYWSYPIYRFQVQENVLRDKTTMPELAVIQEFFAQRAGREGNFLFLDPDQYSVTDQAIAIGNGSRTNFQLVRSTRDYIEPVLAAYAPSVVVKVAGVTTGVTFGANGQINFAAPPANGAAITWSGYYYFLCRFEQDELELAKMFSKLWSIDKIAWKTLKL